jgi:FlaG/FlaF family flagellin (archaellin)
VTPVVGVVLLVALTVVLAATVGAGALALSDPPAPSEPTVLSLSADAGGRVALTHEAGAPLAVESVSVRVSVDGEPLHHQPPVPFFAATGFEGGPTGPFNVAADDRWEAGETASFEVAGTNAPTPSPGATLEVRVYSSGRPVAALSVRL